MLTKAQTALATTKALEFIAEHPLKSEQELHEYLHGLMGGEEAHRADATTVVSQDEVVTARKAAFEAASKAKDAADDAQSQAEAAALLAKAEESAPVEPTGDTPVEDLDHTEAIKLAYFGGLTAGPVVNLPAACKYAKANGLSTDVVADTVARPYSECHAAMLLV